MKDASFLKTNGTLVREKNHLLQISGQELHNDMILQMYEGGSFGAIKFNRKLFIVDTLIRKYISKYIKPFSNRNNITCGCKTFISAMLLKSYITK